MFFEPEADGADKRLEGSVVAVLRGRLIFRLPVNFGCEGQQEKGIVDTEDAHS